MDECDEGAPPTSEQTEKRSRPGGIAREVDPLNEFTHNNVLVTGMFVTLFPLGIGPAVCGSLNTRDRRHLFLQYNPSFAKCSHLNFLIFNQYQRHTGIRRLNACVRNNSAAFKRFQDLVDDPRTVIRLNEAMADATTKDAQVTACARAEAMFPAQ